MAAAMMIENRKRPLDGSPATAPIGLPSPSDPPAKKLQLDSSGVNGTHATRQPFKTEDDDDDDDEQNPAYKGLEAYRKEAIYRQMLESRRDLRRADKKVKALQLTLNDVEDRTGAFNHFWDVLIEEIRVLFERDAIPESQRSALFEVIPFTAGQPSKAAFSASIQERATAVRTVLSRLITIAPQSSSPEVGDLQARCQRLAEEATQLRHQSSSAHGQLQRTTEELHEITERLRRSERRVDRLQSRTVLLSERPSTKAEEEAEKAKVEAAEAEQKAALQRKEAAEASGVEESHAAANGHASAASREEIEQLTRLTQSRLEESDQLRQQNTALRQECERLQLDLHRIPEDRTRETSLYRDLHGHFTYAQQELERLKGVFAALEAENVNLRESRADFEKTAQTEAFSTAESLKEQLKARDADVTRLRAQRDDLNAEIAERRAKDAVKFAQIEESKQLAASKELRVETLCSEVKRLQMALAAAAGDSAEVEKLRSEGIHPEEAELISSLQSRLKAADDRASDLQRQVEAHALDSSNAGLLAQVSAQQKELDGFKALLSGVSSADEASNRLDEQRTKIQRLQDDLAVANESTNALCDEVEKLSRSYSDMSQQATSKVMDLSKMEMTVSRLTAEKTKADQKYFAAMRAKDAVDAGRRAAMVTIERQVAVIERYAEAEQRFTTQVTSHEREVTSLRKMISGYSARIAELERDLKSSRTREAEAQSLRSHTEEKMRSAIGETEEEKSKRARVEEQFFKMERDLEKAKKQAASASAAAGKNGSSSARKGAADSEVDFLRALLQCSSCKDRYRDKIITKCLHTFCSPCIEARIQTRQRKCPHCGLAFATSDIQPLYMQ